MISFVVDIWQHFFWLLRFISPNCISLFLFAYLEDPALITIKQENLRDPEGDTEARENM